MINMIIEKGNSSFFGRFTRVLEKLFTLVFAVFKEIFKKEIFHRFCLKSMNYLYNSKQH